MIPWGKITCGRLDYNPQKIHSSPNSCEVDLVWKYVFAVAVKLRLDNIGLIWALMPGILIKQGAFGHMEDKQGEGYGTTEAAVGVMHPETNQC